LDAIPDFWGNDLLSAAGPDNPVQCHANARQLPMRWALCWI
jgi:hypothetical protein